LRGRGVIIKLMRNNQLLKTIFLVTFAVVFLSTLVFFYSQSPLKTSNINNRQYLAQAFAGPDLVSVCLTIVCSREPAPAEKCTIDDVKNSVGTWLARERRVVRVEGVERVVRVETRASVFVVKQKGNKIYFITAAHNTYPPPRPVLGVGDPVFFRTNSAQAVYLVTRIIKPHTADEVDAERSKDWVLVEAEFKPVSELGLPPDDLKKFVDNVPKLHEFEIDPNYTFKQGDKMTMIGAPEYVPKIMECKAFIEITEGHTRGCIVVEAKEAARPGWSGGPVITSDCKVAMITTAALEGEEGEEGVEDKYTMCIHAKALVEAMELVPE